ncbi:MAG: MotA/TolQ/ExbB proton channel family protein [Chthoniobacter sp.]
MAASDTTTIPARTASSGRRARERRQSDDALEAHSGWRLGDGGDRLSVRRHGDARSHLYFHPAARGHSHAALHEYGRRPAQEAGDYLGLLAISSRHSEAVARVVQRTLDFATKNPTASFEVVKEIAETRPPARPPRCSIARCNLADIGMLSPMVGLLGTVLGIITSFNDLAHKEATQSRDMLLAGGVSQAFDRDRLRFDSRHHRDVLLLALPQSRAEPHLGSRDRVGAHPGFDRAQLQ